ncbi:MAG: hypothetical protein M3416_00545 [Acidobacteriota bacterium]|nr:hypothetical protein [Acidobacteriota bacterium]
MLWPLPLWMGYLLFFGVPFTFWLVAGAAAALVGFRSPLLAFIGGSDARLSLSRLQAFLWTFIIFGAYVAAMVVSKKVTAAQWIQIPPELLALAGISLASGVFSSLIAAVAGETKRAEVTSLTRQDPKKDEWTVTGVNLGNDGSLRFRRDVFSPISWKDGEIKFVAPELSNERLKGPMIVDTPNGKACYEITAVKDPSGQPITEYELKPRVCYEFVDLFRDDKNPRVLSLMKFQMFGWTLVAILLYIILYLYFLNPEIERLPNVDRSIALLTGISQAGYLAGKGTSIVSDKS